MDHHFILCIIWTLKTEQYKQKQAYHSRNWMAQKFRLITKVIKHIRNDVKDSNQLVTKVIILNFI
jgi:hypothetical protein